MPQSIPDILVYGLIVAGFLLFNYVTQRLAAKARRQQQEAELDQLAQAQAAADEPLDYTWGRAGAAPALEVEPPKVPVDIAPAPAVTTIDVSARPHAAARNLLRSRKDLRHAVVLMTVLGPCRALEPYDNR